jgi:hypothetical protein
VKCNEERQQATAAELLMLETLSDVNDLNMEKESSIHDMVTYEPISADEACPKSDEVMMDIEGVAAGSSR